MISTNLQVLGAFLRAARKMESGPPESCKTMKNRGMIPENNHKIRPKGRILFCDCLTQYAERKPAIGRTVSACLTARTVHQTRAWPPALPGKNPPFPEKRGIFHTNCSTQYAEREPATGRAVSARLTTRKTHQARIVSGDSPLSQRPAAGSLRRWRSL